MSKSAESRIVVAAIAWRQAYLQAEAGAPNTPAGRLAHTEQALLRAVTEFLNPAGQNSTPV